MRRIIIYSSIAIVSERSRTGRVPGHVVAKPVCRRPELTRLRASRYGAAGRDSTTAG